MVCGVCVMYNIYVKAIDILFLIQWGGKTIKIL